MPRIMFIELNEINFEFIDGYIARGELPHFREFFGRHGYVRTSSEKDHERVNPWIQWVTAHTGLDLADHGVFRMGDMCFHEHEQIWERLEQAGLRVGALAPFNATNRTRAAAFFVPDPWMRTPFAGSFALRCVYTALCQVANDYAEGRITLGSVARLGVGALAYMRWHNALRYASDTLGYLRRGRWHRALFADRFLGDIFLSLWQRARPDFASVCLNGGAHLQHHYMFSSPLCESRLRNPEWWLGPGADPVLEAYRLYDRILGDLRRADPEARIMLVTALHQEPHERVAHYYRLNDHRRTLAELGIPFDNFAPLMTEDFLLEYADKASAARAQSLLEAVEASERDVFYLDTGDVANYGVETSRAPFFVDNRGTTLYVQLKPTARELPPGLRVTRGDRRIEDFPRHTAHAQLKNGHHTGIGYFADSGVKPGELPSEFPLRDLPLLVQRAFHINPAQPLPGRIGTTAASA